MSIKLIHVSDIHFGSGESHGRLNPETGLNVRFEDFSRAFEKVVDFAIANEADVFLFAGDAYKTASPEPVQQKAFASQLRRLSAAKIPTILLVGNHDQILKGGSSHSMSVFQSLEVPAVEVIHSPRLLKVETKNGVLQIVGMPHITRHLLITQEKYAGLSAAELDRILVKLASEILQDLYGQLDEKLPAVATAHMMTDTARAGAEQELLVGYSMTFPLSLLIDEKLDYVALGHVHGHQVLRQERPVIIYSGSLERVDFGEEGEDKGFIEVDIERANVKWKFHSINPRPFITLECDLTESENPTADLILQAKEKARQGSVFRIKYKIQDLRLPELDEDQVRKALPEVLSLRFKPQLLSTERPRRHPEINEKSVLQPLAALGKFLDEKAPESKEALIKRAEQLISRHEKDGISD